MRRVKIKDLSLKDLMAMQNLSCDGLSCRKCPLALISKVTGNEACYFTKEEIINYLTLLDQIVEIDSFSKFKAT